MYTHKNNILKVQTNLQNNVNGDMSYITRQKKILSLISSIYYLIDFLSQPLKRAELALLGNPLFSLTSNLEHFL